MSYLSDILEQPQVLRSLVDTYQDDSRWSALLSEPSSPLILTGMGSSYYSLVPMGLYLNQHQQPAIHIEASELVHYGLEMLNPQTRLVIVSQSGESVEIRRLVEQARARTTIISITNTSDNFLARHSHIPLSTQAGTEVPVATKTYTSGLALLHLLSHHLIGKRQPQDYQDLLRVADAMEQVLGDWLAWLQPAVDHLQSTTFISLLGRGPAVASAMTGALILKEAARINAAGLSGGQFRHGPMEAVEPESGVIIFASPGRTHDLSQRLASDIASRGGRVVLVGQSVPDPAVVSLALPVVDEWLAPIIEVVAVQLLAAQLAEQKGLVPGEFRWSGKVIHEE